MRQEIAIDGFRLAYDRTGQGPRNPAVLLLHGWPGDRTDHRDVVPLLADAAEVGRTPFAPTCGTSGRTGPGRTT